MAVQYFRERVETSSLVRSQMLFASDSLLSLSATCKLHIQENVPE